MSHYYQERFPSFWEDVDEQVDNRQILSVKEVYRELEYRTTEEFMWSWIEKNKKIFKKPNEREMNIVSQILGMNKFRGLVKEKNIWEGKPSADPFIVASAKIRNGCVVTEEKYKPNAAKIPNACEHFSVKCINMNEYMQREKMKY